MIKKYWKEISGIAILTFGVLLLRIYVFELYTIPSSSMEPTLHVGDYIIVNKMSYGARVTKLWELLSEKKIEYRWHINTNKIKKGDVFVFNWPNYSTLNDKYPNIYGNTLVKRCFGLPNDTVEINNKLLKELKVDISGEDEFSKPYMFPHDSTLNWTLSRYGPLWVPAKGKTISLTSKVAYHYKDILLYEGNKITTNTDSVFLNGIYKPNYTFQFNYYFMKGDNFYGSIDSRYWGFVPERNIVGKVAMVLFSIDPNEPWYKCFRWNRVCKMVK